MPKLVIIALCLFAVIWSGQSSPLFETPQCKDVNDIDKLISQYNDAVITKQEAISDIADFIQDYRMTLLWFVLPWKTNVYGLDGILTLGNMTRSGGVSECSTSTYTSLQGNFEYDKFDVSYSMTAKFIKWEIDGRFSCTVRNPKVNLVYTKNSLGCLISSLELVDWGKRECSITSIGGSFKDSLIGKAVHYSLLSKQASPDPPLVSFRQAVYSMIETNFGWC